MIKNFISNQLSVRLLEYSYLQVYIVNYVFLKI